MKKQMKINRNIQKHMASRCICQEHLVYLISGVFLRRPPGAFSRIIQCIWYQVNLANFYFKLMLGCHICRFCNSWKDSSNKPYFTNLPEACTRTWSSRLNCKKRQHQYLDGGILGVTSCKSSYFWKLLSILLWKILQFAGGSGVL